jgi:uncharacterized protein YjcR
VETWTHQPSKQRKQASEDYRSGLGVSELARRYNVSRQRVYKWLEKEGIIPRESAKQKVKA